MSKYLSDKQLAERWGVSRSTVRRWVRNKQLPPPTKLSSGCSRWSENIAQKFEATRQQAVAS